MKKYKPRLTIELPREKKDELVNKAASSGFTLRGLVLRWIDNFLNKKNWKF